MEGSPAEQTSSLRGGSGASASPDAIAWGLLGLSLLAHLLLVPARGWERDLYWFATWMRTSLEAGAAHVADKVWCDYPPGYIYLLETVGFLWKLFTRGDLPPDSSLAMRFLLKLLPITADLSGAWALYRIALPRLGRISALLVLSGYAFNPAMIFNSALWGQADSVLSLLLILSFWALCSRRSAAAFALLAAAILVKFQAVVLLPVFLLGALSLQGPEGIRAAYRGSGWTSLALLLPFFWAQRVETVIQRAFEAVGRYPFISMNAHNVWWLVGRESSPRTSDAMRIGNAFLTYHTIGFAMFALASLLVLCKLWSGLRGPRAEKEAVIAEAAALQVLAFYLFPTEMHERYIVPALVFLAVLCVWKPLAWWLYGVASAAVFFSLASTLNANYPDHVGPLGQLFPPGREDALLLSGFFIMLFGLLLLWGAHPRFLLLAPLSAAGLAVLLGGVSKAGVKSPQRLCEWEPVEERQDWGERHRDRTVDANRLSVDGFIFRHGIGTHARSRLTYHLNGAFSALDTAFGIDDEANKGQRIRFRILADGQVRYDSGDVTVLGFPYHATVDVRKTSFLTLEVLDGGDGINSDHADWLEPVLFR